ncbi:MAG: hypothetical protein H7Y60_09015 [Rhodospirillaceae bacterium]|nr:hypothetical protein [Rhodospirillales bacterium]
MGEQRPPRPNSSGSPGPQRGAAGVYERPARRIPWAAMAAGIAVAAAALGAVLWLT